MLVPRCLRVRLRSGYSSLYLSIYLSTGKVTASAALLCTSFYENIAMYVPLLLLKISRDNCHLGNYLYDVRINDFENM